MNNNFLPVSSPTGRGQVVAGAGDEYLQPQEHYKHPLYLDVTGENGVYTRLLIIFIVIVFGNWLNWNGATPKIRKTSAALVSVLHLVPSNA